ncbi:MAG TPA: glycosyltransferase [Candidatus Binataceae bacterium]|nr:glycosyltransferase [Candidatus Binataceae bacterium]
MARLAVRGKYIFDGAQKFYARGVSYGPFAENSRGERYPEPEQAERDFALMRQLGANVIRVYVPPPAWMFELAAKHKLRMMVGMPWPFHMAFLDSRQMTREIRETIRQGVSSMRQFGDTVFAWSLGNEIRSDIVRWHSPRAVNRFLTELYDIGKQIDPEGLFTYSNYPSTEYLELNSLDFVSYNVYLHREEDFRRYLTHLLAITGDRPLVLSETGMDTIREGEEHQAELLAWQGTAAFEIGLSGFIVFAFTDEWHTGGSEITDWAFGLVTRERTPKKAFYAVGDIFKAPLPPPLGEPPKASVVVCAYNAGDTIGPCLDTLAHLNYPAYETIVVDDGSTDATAAIAKARGVRTLTLEHCGLSFARNAGIIAAEGNIVAFLDADAEADQDWLYHLVEAITRRQAAAVGGRNFPPPAASNLAAALALAPGLPGEVRLGGDELEQLCGCSMALDKSKIGDAPYFDTAFVTAGDDVDFSWRLRERGARLAYAPAAVVTHRPRAAIRSYLRQQRGYGHAEGLLHRKYPRRTRNKQGMYGGWLAPLFSGGARIYYGAFGRGLFQTLYSDGLLAPVAELPLTIQWVGAACLLILALPISRVAPVIGLAGIVITIASAAAAAILEPSPRLSRAGRTSLALLWLLGPIVRSYERTKVIWSFNPDVSHPADTHGARWRGRFALTVPPDSGMIGPAPDRLMEAVHEALVRRGAAVAVTDGYEPYDLEIHVPPLLRAPILILQQQWELGVGWRVLPELTAIVPGLAILFVALLLIGLPAIGAIAGTIAALAIVGAVAWQRVKKLPALIAAAVADAARRFGLCVAVDSAG